MNSTDYQILTRIPLLPLLGAPSPRERVLGCENKERGKPMFFDEIIHGTQYYRAPTPLPEEWEGDIARMESLALDAFQIRINWRWNERQEGVYDFSDVDKLMELAQAHGRKVIIKLLLECAPQYVFDKYGGARIGPKGEVYRGGSHGAFYGGWLPCFTNPQVKAAAVRFVEAVAQRYCGYGNVILWKAWNEIRNRPAWECFCPHCRAAFGEYLKEKFGTVEALNAFYGTAEDSFETVALPMMPHGYWDIYEFKKFKGSKCLYDDLRFVYEAIRKYDKDRPIMSHVGHSGAFQKSINDVVDDYAVSKAVDFWGTSISCSCDMSTHHNRMDFMMILDFLRAVDENYFLHEIYPGLGMFKAYDTPFDMNFKLYTALSSGAKGLVYWQLRAERIGNEQDCAGLLRMDGSPREVAFTVGNFGRELRQNAALFAKAKVKPADIAIVYDFNSMLLSEIEDSCGKLYSFDTPPTVMNYRYTHAGMYRLLKDCDYPVDYVGVTQPEKFEKYKVLYFPYYTMLDPVIVPHLQAFLERGGTVIADEGFGMRTLNTWMQPYDIACKPILTARLTERRQVEEEIAYGGLRSRFAPFKSQYAVENGTCHMRFADGTPALQSVAVGKGRLYLFGCSIGYSYYTTEDALWKALLADILKDSGAEKLPYSNQAQGICEKRMVAQGREIIFLFNNSTSEKTFEMPRTPLFVGGFGRPEGGKLHLPANSMAYVMNAE